MQNSPTSTSSGALLSRRLLPGMLERGWDRIVFISSESGVNVPADMIHYGASKAAMLAFGNGLAKLTKGTGVTVNSVLGGPTYSVGVARTVEALAAQTGLAAEEMKQAAYSASFSASIKSTTTSPMPRSVPVRPSIAGAGVLPGTVWPPPSTV